MRWARIDRPEGEEVKRRILIKPCKAEGTGFSFIYAGGAPVLPIVGTVRCDPHFFSLTTTAQWVAEWFGEQLGIPVRRMLGERAWYVDRHFHRRRQ